MERNASYELEMIDELPDTATNSPLEDQLRRIQYDPERHAPRWGRIGRYGGPSHAAAAGSAANILRKRHGDTPDVEGWRFETRRIEEGTATGLFAQYNPERIIPGEREKNVERYEEFKQSQREAAQRRAEKKAAASRETVDA